MRAFLVAGVVLGTASAAFAQAQIVPTDSIKAAEKNDVSGWAPFLGLTSTIALADNSSVVGQVDGFSTLFGLGITGGADYVEGPHLVRTSLAINESFARTPVVDQFVKTNDVVKLDGIYNYFVTPVFGAYGRLNFTTDLFSATDIRGTPTSWVLVNPDKTTSPLSTGAFSQKLASPFSPFTINESAGAFADPLRKPWGEVSVRAGVGGRHTFADGVYVLADDKTTPEVEVLKLSDVQQLGVEGFAGAIGKVNGGKASYKVGLSVLLPFVNNDKYNRSAGSLTRVGFEGGLTFNMYSWMSMVYSLAVTRDPQLFAQGQEKVQVQNSLLLTFQFSLVKKREKAKEPTKEELELKAAKERADAAEKRAQEAEQKLQQATPPPAPPPPTTPAPTPDTPPAPPTPPSP